MPYTLKDNCVINSETGETIPGGCHDSHQEALAHLQALEANVHDLHKTQAGKHDWEIFIPLAKVDAARQEVWGNASIEEQDASGEIMDFEASLPHFEAWSRAAKSRSGGKSLGNVREQHDPKKVAGRLIHFEIDRLRRAFPVGAHVVDPVSWLKVDTGSLTGFSIGGRYGKRWPDPQRAGVWRYEAIPEELSIVDAPCVYNSAFQVIKADGSIEQRLFKSANTGLRLEIAMDDTQEATSTGSENTDGQAVESPELTKAQPIETIVSPPLLPQGTTVPSVVEAVSETEKSLALAVSMPGPTSGPSATSVPDTQTLINAGEAPRALDAAPFAAQSQTANRSVRKVKKMSKKTVITKTDANAQRALVFEAVKLQAALKAAGEDVEESLLKSAGDSITKLTRAVRGLAKGDVGNVVTAASSLVTALNEQAAKGEVDAGLLANIGQTLGTLAEMVSNMEPAAEAAMTDAASALDEPVTDAPDPAATQDIGGGNGSPMGKVGGLPAAAGRRPLATTPPKASMLAITSPGAAVEAILPEFANALVRKDLRKAKEITGFDEEFFNKAFSETVHQIMDEMEFTWGNRREVFAKGLGGVPSQSEVAALIKQHGTLEKAITAGDMPGINLLPLVRVMLPAIALMGSSIPITTPRSGSDQATWRALLGFGSTSESDTMSVAEGDIGTAMDENFVTYNAPYRDTTDNSKVSLKSTRTSLGFDDPLQVSTYTSLAFLIRIRDRNLLYSNSAAIAAPTIVSGSVSGGSTGGTLTASATWAVAVTALTGRGETRVLVDGVPAGGSVAIGETTAGSLGSITAGSPGNTGSITVSWPFVPGATGYNIYVSGSAGTGFRYVATTGKTSYTITAYPSTGNSFPTSNTTENLLGYEGLQAWCTLPSVYGQTSPNKVSVVDVAGGALTASADGIDQINTVLSDMWAKWHATPTRLVCSPTTKRLITKKLLSQTNPALYRIDISAERGRFEGGAMVDSIVNLFAGEGDVHPSVKIQGNPYMFDGNIQVLCESIPYAAPRTTQAFEAEQLLPFTYFPLAHQNLNFPFALTLSETLICNHAPAQSAVVGFSNS